MFADLIATFLEWLNSFISVNVPTFGVNDNLNAISSAVDALCEFIAAVNFVIPLPDIAVIIVADLAIRFSQLTLFLINWVVRRIADIIP